MKHDAKKRAPAAQRADKRGTASRGQAGRAQKSGTGVRGQTGRPEKSDAGSRGPARRAEKSGAGVRGQTGRPEKRGAASRGPAGRAEKSSAGARGPAGRADKSGAASRGPAGRAEKSGAATRTLTVRDPAELLAFLLAEHPGQGRNSVKSMLARGQVSVGGRAVTAYNHPLKSGDTVTILKGKAPEAMRFVGMNILHEDDDIIVIRKDAGLLSVATAEEKELTAYRQLTEYVRRENAGNRIFVLHRLDRDTSGVMMFARSEQVQQQMQNAWKDVVTERTYTALVEGQVRQPEGTVESWLKENAAMKMYSSPHSGDGVHAITHYKLLRPGRQYSLLEIRLETGRKNQIRVHMQDIGHPIAGDKKYGAKTKPIGRLGLHASVLAFVHPSTGETMRFKADVPKVFMTVFAET